MWRIMLLQSLYSSLKEVVGTKDKERLKKNLVYLPSSSETAEPNISGTHLT